MARSDISGLNGKDWGEAVGLVLDQDLGKLTFARWEGLTRTSPLITPPAQRVRSTPFIWTLQSPISLPETFRLLRCGNAWNLSRERHDCSTHSSIAPNSDVV